MRYIAIFSFAAALLVVGGVASAQDTFQGRGIGLIWGDQLNVDTTTTNDTTGNWGFESDFVRVCLEADTGQAAVPVFVRFGVEVVASQPAKSVTNDLEYLSIVATSDTIFRGGSSDANPAVLQGRAIRLSPESSASVDTTAQTCITHPWRTHGIVINHGDATAVNTTAAATVDVWAYRSSMQKWDQPR